MEHHGEIMQRLGTIQGQVQEGFTGIHRRQDITNGRIGKLEARVDTLEKEDVRSHQIMEENTRFIDGSRADRDKWFDRGLNVVIHIIGFLAFAVLVKTGIINL